MREVRIVSMKLVVRGGQDAQIAGGGARDEGGEKAAMAEMRGTGENAQRLRLQTGAGGEHLESEALAS